jgi:dienelactone hydrolase
MMIRTIGREADERGYILAAPMGYNLQGCYGAAGATSARTTPSNLGELSEKDVLHVLENVRREFNIDDRRIYLLGQSMGGAGALHLASKYPDIWAAVAAAAPALREQQQPAQLEAIRQLPIILVHGDNDLAVPIEQSRIWAAKMKELQMTYEYREVRGGSHGDALTESVDRVFGFFGKHRKPAAAPQPGALPPWTLETLDVVELALPAQIRTLEERADKVVKGVHADHNGDGTDDYVVQSTMCTPGGCPYAIYNGKTNAKIGAVFGNMIIVRAESTREFANIDTYSYLSAQAGTVTSYVFDGTAYVVKSRQQAEGQLVQDLFAGWNQIPRWQLSR